MASIKKDDDLRSFDVPEATRHSGGYTVYKIVLQVTPKELTENSYQLIYWKRYTDIRKLYDTLNRYHQAIYRPGTFPNFPVKSGYMERFNPAVVEERRLATKQFLNFAIQQMYLRTHDSYTNFFQKGEKVLLPDVETDTLKPESNTSSLSSSEIPAPILPSPVQPVVVNEKKDELLLNVDEEQPIEHNNNTSDRILDDLNDLTFEQNEGENTDLLTLPSTTTTLPSNTDTNDSSQESFFLSQ